jgi:hypothetical protein
VLGHLTKRLALAGFMIAQATVADAADPTVGPFSAFTFADTTCAEYNAGGKETKTVIWSWLEGYFWGMFAASDANNLNHVTWLRRRIDAMKLVRAFDDGCKAMPTWTVSLLATKVFLEVAKGNVKEVLSDVR